MTNLSCVVIRNVIIYEALLAALIFCKMDLSVVAREVMEERS